jgi:hypothetical protein
MRDATNANTQTFQVLSGSVYYILSRLLKRFKYLINSLINEHEDHQAVSIIIMLYGDIGKGLRRRVHRCYLQQRGTPPTAVHILPQTKRADSAPHLFVHSVSSARPTCSFLVRFERSSAVAIPKPKKE